MLTKLKMLYEMVLAKCSSTTIESFMTDIFDEYQGVEVYCDDADIVATWEGAIDDKENCVIRWQGINIYYDPWEDWGGDEI